MIHLQTIITQLHHEFTLIAKMLMQIDVKVDSDLFLPTSVCVCVCVCIPEWSSLTSEDTVLVMESAATRRSFLRFLLEPGDIQSKTEQNKKLTVIFKFIFTFTNWCTVINMLNLSSGNLSNNQN